ncbi:hypothetical protein J9253_12470 [Thiothrix litoralis]|jgi:hypothetical protein|uniref:Uncharacterized protein n=1 Tax=Thiothrix litoralis TaxID=2891210 RepID=A0ABX7WP02_9GAMM|nr:hypothetical protein [Thiothrix litoralis]QTR44832.1 hypothetical protein J9253_12470 [Thiothrix litoralis]
MDILTILFVLLLGAAAGSWLGHYSGYREGLVKGKHDGVKEGMKEYLRKELIESKALGGSYNIEALFQVREELQGAIQPKQAQKKEKSSWLAWVILALTVLWLWGSIVGFDSTY